jgi:hypothetical protein
MMQFTTIKGMNRPKDASTSGAKALMHICKMVTNEAITTINAGIRTISGTIFLMSEIIKFEKMSTAIVANPIDMPLSAELVVPRVGHIPKRRTKVGFSLIIPFQSTFK